MSATDEDCRVYRRLVEEFRHLTRYTGSNGLCCRDVWDGAPRCCYQIADGAALTFTGMEVSILDRLNSGLKFSWWDGPKPYPNLLARESAMSKQEVLASAHNGWLADTLECASHPTRPVLVGKRVVAVAVVRDCNTPIALEEYERDVRELRGMWQQAIDLTGMKPYYVTERLDNGLILL